MGEHGRSAATRVYVTREWDCLAEAVVGRAVDFTFPARAAEEVSVLRFLPEALRARAADLAGKRWSQADPEGFARCAEQLDAWQTSCAAAG